MSKEEYKLETLYGGLSIPDWPDDLIVRSLRELGEWAAAEGILASCLMDEGETLWDAGAFLGTFALGVAKEVMLGRVHAVEANIELAPFLTQNLRTLTCNSTASLAGLSRNAGWLVADNESHNNHGATTYTYQAEQPDIEEVMAIPCQTLKQMREEHGDYDMLKLDLEGMERDALLGDIEFLRSRRPVIWAECNESFESLKVFSALKWLGYDVFYTAFPAFRSVNFRGVADLIYPMAYEAALVAGLPSRLKRLKYGSISKVQDEDIICRKLETSFDLRKALFDTPRWAHKDWIGLSRAELMARLGRKDQNQTLKTYLNSPLT